ncbi:MAG: hypothetical protein A2161_20590 [Candidatus Schekmanbacteria bacterium RBG_13_48_7]|uniref:Uncharacterized protein n=1 Tax=Candidatus Schekmanbacteria bacterium RBG_13_48_7 TaxID=1817878 RepID=A0A1F7RQ98_9BACT|nr:MAG: hypothetical protein A2161_20590 [Candidatus Schekmanbacteria bacterium RBG_13_48_7]
MGQANEILYFSKSGKQGTKPVLQKVKDYLLKSNIKDVLVASISGQTALYAAKEFEGLNQRIICVSGSPSWKEHFDFPLIPENNKKKLIESGIVVLENLPSTFSDTIEYSIARYGIRPASWLVVETLLAIGGYGLKTAVEVALMATDAGIVEPYTEVVSIGGTKKGADTAIVLKTTFANQFFSDDPDKRFELKEFLAMVRNKTWYKNVMVGDWRVHERR